MALLATNKKHIFESASFTTNTSTVPYLGFYNAILTFTIINQCTGKASWVKRVTVFTGFSKPSCQIAFFNSTTLPVERGCTYDPDTSTGIFSKNIGGSEGEVWKVFGVLAHGHTFTTYVNITLSHSRDSTSPIPVLIIAASVGTIIILSIIIVVCGVRKIGRATQDASNVQSESTGDSYYLHAISPPAEQRRSQPAKTSVETQTLRRHTGEDEYGYTLPDGLQSIASRQVVTKSPCQVTGASTSMSNTDVRVYRQDDDGYVLADSDDTKEDDERRYENSARDSVRPHKSHTNKFGDEGYMLPGSTGPWEGHFGTSEAEYQN
ncbi:uncharacterized protein [Littorina saxatilis]|uniref:uncharacterized protein n=1 Tax=Littorina saxatilis TaxID=31220 RepID=UPI0038B421AC